MKTPADYVDSWEARIEQVAKIVGKTPEEVEEILNAPPYQITQDPNRLEMLSDEDVTPFGDMRKMFCDDNGVTLPQLRLAMKWLRGPKGSTRACRGAPAGGAAPGPPRRRLPALVRLPGRLR